VISDASRSITTGSTAVDSWSGACSPARAQALARACCLAPAIAVMALSASSARAAIRRDTVGSDATGP